MKIHQNIQISFTKAQNSFTKMLPDEKETNKWPESPEEQLRITWKNYNYYDEQSMWW